MFPQEWPTLFRMTLETEFIYRVRLQHLRPRSAMLVMTLGAFHQAFLQWMVRLFINLSADTGMAGEAKSRLGHL